MKCIKCKTKNINKANYCKKCGYHFSKKEQEASRKWSFVWFLEKKDKIMSIIDLSIITDNIFFKIASIVLILGVGVYSILTNGINLKLLESKDYKIQYNTSLSEYYLLVNQEQTNLNLYIPNRTEKLIIKHLNGNELIEEKEYNGEEIVLDSNTYDEYYLIEATYDNNNLDRIKLYVYYEEDSE